VQMLFSCTVKGSPALPFIPIWRRSTAGEMMITMRSARLPMVAVVLMLAVSACGSHGAGFPPPPRTAPVASPVTLSSDGRVITARGVIACGHRPLLIARSHPNRVTLTWVNPGTHCDAEAIKPIAVSVSLPSALGTRQLVQASTGKPIRYHISQGS